MLRQEANIVTISNGAQHCSRIAPLHGHSKSLSQVVVVRLELSSLHLQMVPKPSSLMNERALPKHPRRLYHHWDKWWLTSSWRTSPSSCPLSGLRGHLFHLLPAHDLTSVRTHHKPLTINLYTMYYCPTCVCTGGTQSAASVCLSVCMLAKMPHLIAQFMTVCTYVQFSIFTCYTFLHSLLSRMCCCIECQTCGRNFRGRLLVCQCYAYCVRHNTSVDSTYHISTGPMQLIHLLMQIHHV